VDLAGGTGTRTLKAVLVGGPTGGLLPAELLDTPYASDALRAAGAHIGSGSVVIADDRACIVDLARLLTRFSADQACGKTIPCRIGLRRLAEIGDRIAEGRPKPTDATLVGDLAHDIVASALCDHERLAVLPLTSGMRYFRSEIDDHLLRSTCPAGVCTPIAVAVGAATPGRN
jgi:NADH:ubiquinone oxidoreductase subunit F (NADH-binding)